MDFRRQRTAFGNICAHRLHISNAAMDERVLELCFATWCDQRSDAVGKRGLASGQQEAEDELKRRYAQSEAHEDELRRRLALIRTDEAELEKRRAEVEKLEILSQNFASSSLVQAKAESVAPHVVIEPKLDSVKNADSQRPPDGNTEQCAPTYTRTHIHITHPICYVSINPSGRVQTHM